LIVGTGGFWGAPVKIRSARRERRHLPALRIDPKNFLCGATFTFNIKL